MRIAVHALALIGAVGLTETQTGGTVLTASDIEYPHLLWRPVVVEGREWLGLRVFEDSSRIERVETRWIGSAEAGDSTFTLSVHPAGPILLVADVPQVSVGPATTLSRYEQTLASGDGPLGLELGSRRYTLTLRGTAPGLCDATVTLSDGTTSQELYFPAESSMSCDEPHFSVQWAGDLDGDGRLDLVTTFSPKYSFYPRRLFLSSAAAPGALVGLAAAFDAAAA